MSVLYALPLVLPVYGYHQRVFSSPLPSKNLSVAVIVPVKNEAVHLSQILDALRLQEDDRGNRLHSGFYEVLVLVNNSTDHSFKIARNYQATHPDFKLLVAEMIFPEKDAHIGTVRRKLMDEAHDRLMSVGDGSGIIASTDGDTIVDSQWVFQIMSEIGRGTDAVGGRIIAIKPETISKRFFELNEEYRTLVARVESLIDPVHHDPWPGHFQYYGASLAVTCSMYEKAGRLPSIPFLEDEALHQALLAKDARIRKSTAVKVFTSSRLEGRVKVGFSEQLGVWNNMAEQNLEQYEVSAEDVIARFKQRKMLRTYREKKDMKEPVNALTLFNIAHTLQVAPTWLQEQLSFSHYFGQLWQSVEAHTHYSKALKPRRKVPIGQAIKGLTRFTDRLVLATF